MSEKKKHHPQCFQNRPDSLKGMIEDGFPSDLCDCRIWHMFDSSHEHMRDCESTYQGAYPNGVSKWSPCKCWERIQAAGLDGVHGLT